MKASEVIKELERLIAERGDLDCHVSGGCCVDPVECLHVYQPDKRHKPEIWIDSDPRYRNQSSP